MAAPGSVRCFPTQLPPRSPLGGCTSSRAECRWRTLADTRGRASGRRSDRKCGYISGHNRLMPGGARKKKLRDCHRLLRHAWPTFTSELLLRMKSWPPWPPPPLLCCVPPLCMRLSDISQPTRSPLPTKTRSRGWNEKKVHRLCRC